MLSQELASVLPLEEVGSSAGSLGDFPVKTKMRCAPPVLGTVRDTGWALLGLFG